MNVSFLGTSQYATYRQAQMHGVCVPNLHPILFRFRQNDENSWMVNLAAVSGRPEDGKIDGQLLLRHLLEDALITFNTEIIRIPRKAYIQDKGNFG